MNMATLTEDEVLSALKQCYDPEIPVNIVDLGLIYGVRFDPAPEEKQDVTVEMTLTAQGCPSHVRSENRSRPGWNRCPACAMPRSTWSGLRRGLRSGSAPTPAKPWVSKNKVR